jgi:hypothetical protein
MAKTPKISTRLSAANLERLGAERLSLLLMEAGNGNANFKRRLRLELAAEAGPGVLAAEIDKRVLALAIARTRVSWRRRGDLLEDLGTHLEMITERLAPMDEAAALNSLIEWFELYSGLIARVKDQKGELPAFYEAAAPELFALAATADEAGLKRLAEMMSDHAGLYSRWLAADNGALSQAAAKALIDVLPKTLTKSPSGRNLIRRLADRALDLDLWLSLVTPEQVAIPEVAAEIGLRLVEAGRVAEARKMLQGVKRMERPGGLPPPLPPVWEETMIAVLDAEGETAEAQERRWALFEREMSAQVLRDYVARLPDFEDVEAVDRALAMAAEHPMFVRGMRFLMDWPAYREAAALVKARPKEARLIGDANDWADKLTQRFPEATEVMTGRKV